MKPILYHSVKDGHKSNDCRHTAVTRVLPKLLHSSPSTWSPSQEVRQKKSELFIVRYSKWPTDLRPYCGTQTKSHLYTDMTSQVTMSPWQLTFVTLLFIWCTTLRALNTCITRHNLILYNIDDQIL